MNVQVTLTGVELQKAAAYWLEHCTDLRPVMWEQPGDERRPESAQFFDADGNELASKDVQLRVAVTGTIAAPK